MQDDRPLYLNFKQVFHIHYQPLCQFAFTFIKDEHACEDIVQEIFLHIWEKKSELIEKTEIRFYLYTAVRNQCLRFIQQRKKTQLVDVSSQDISTAQHPESAETPDFSLLVTEALDRLPEKCREVFTLSRYGALTYQQISETLGISIKTVENQIGKALKIMRSFVREKHFLMVISIYFFISTLTSRGFSNSWFY